MALWWVDSIIKCQIYAPPLMHITYRVVEIILILHIKVGR